MKKYREPKRMILLATIISASSLINVGKSFANNITDIKGHWAETQIVEFIKDGHVGGYEDNTFKPNDSITRAEFVKIFNKYFGLKNRDGHTFEDTKTHWASAEIDIAVTNGVANGVSETEFMPNEPITREQACKMIFNYFGINENNRNLEADQSYLEGTSYWALDAVRSAVMEGYMNGYEDNTFKPKNNITRAEAVATLSRISDNRQRISSAIKNTNETGFNSIGRWSSVKEQSMFMKGGYKYLVDELEDEILVTKLDSHTLRLEKEIEIEKELPLYGGFYEGEDHYFVIFGQEDKEEIGTKEVIRIVRYDKNFNRVDSISLTGNDCYTKNPFDFSTLSMNQNDNELVIHTSRIRPLTEDGLNHQSQLTIVLDLDTMTIKNDLGRFQSNHVSHSFNQLVKHDDGKAILVDHGDAHPRSVALNILDTENDISEEIDLLKIPGESGANQTGVTLGGFEISDETYLVAINKIDFSKVSSFTSYEMVGLDKDERDAVLLVYDKETQKTSEIYLTDYVDKNRLASTPKLVKVNNDEFVVMWQEFELLEYGYNNLGLKYVKVDKNGNKIGAVETEKKLNLSKYVQPIVDNNEIVWFTDSSEVRLLNKIVLD